MKEDEQTVADEGDEEELHHDQLMALLHDLVRKHGGRRGAARVLGIDRRTVAACMDGRGMSWRMREALERRVDALEKELRGGPRRSHRRDREAAGERSPEMGVVGGGCLAGRHRESPLGRLTCWMWPHGGRRRPRQQPGRRRPGSRSVCTPSWWTKEPAPDDEEVYGEAWPLIEEWRRLWKTHSAGGRGLAWLEVEERVRELEVAMLEEHGLTLPPETMPLTGLWRSSQLNWRRETLREVRRAVAWRRLARRILTLNLWRQ